MGNRILFAAPEPSYHPLEFEGELLWVPRETSNPFVEDGIPCLLLQFDGATRLIVYFHANAEDLGTVYSDLRTLRTLLGVHVLAVEYPGYGVCSGTPSEKAVLADAETVFRFVWQQLEVPVASMMFMGRSLGGGPAIHLASRYPVAGLVTVNTFCSVEAVVGVHGKYLWGMTGWLADKFENVRRIRKVHCPALIIQGSADALVDVSQGEELATNCGIDAACRHPVVLHIRDGKGHNNMNWMLDIIRPMENNFVDIREGAPISLSLAEWFFYKDPTQVDSLYGSGWIPSGRQYCD